MLIFANGPVFVAMTHYHMEIVFDQWIPAVVAIAVDDDDDYYRTQFFLCDV